MSLHLTQTVTLRDPVIRKTEREDAANAVESIFGVIRVRKLTLKRVSDLDCAYSR